MKVEELATRAQQLRELHHADAPLVLPNAWDAGSARAVVQAGFPAVATSSSAVAESLGWRDGEDIPPAEMFAAVARISRAVDAPVSADIEGGYGLAPDELARRLIDAGAAGCNFEDTDHQGGGMHPLERQVERIRGLVEAARSLGAALVVNARIDAFLQRDWPLEQQLRETLTRGPCYRAAGASCVYPIFVRDEPTLRELASGLDGPVNALTFPGGPSVAQLTALGFSRISLGGGLYRALGADLARRLAELRGA